MQKNKLKSILSIILGGIMLIGTMSISVLGADAEPSASYAVTVDNLSYIYRSYFNGICDNLDTATTKNVSYDSTSCLEVTPNPNTTAASSRQYINLDSYSWQSLNIDLSKYGTCVILYKYISDNPIRTTAQLRILPQSIFSTQKILYSRESVVANKWATVSFDLASARSIIKDDVKPIIKQLHYLPLGQTSVKRMSADDKFIISKIFFFPDESRRSAYRRSYITGMTDSAGNSIFNSSGLLTRSQAATMIARIAADGDRFVTASDGVSAYSDVTSHGAAKYIEYLEDLGFLRGYTEKEFYPDSYMSQTEFAELAHLLERFLNDGKKRFISDHAEKDFPLATLTAKGKITRAEAVIMLNMVIGRNPNADGVFDQFKNKYADIPEGHYARGDILDASLDHIALVDKNGVEYWAMGQGNANATENFVPDYTTGTEKLNEAKQLFNDRVAEIQNTQSKQFNIKGKTIYVSTYGSDDNSGLSESEALRTVAAANKLAVSGDLVLFERGCEWRERWVSKSGVTYSAYGAGPKPVFNGNVLGNAADPKLWTLVEGTTNVYKYAHKTYDVGNIVLKRNGTTSTVTKLTPNINNSQMLLNNKVFDPATSMTQNNSFISIYDGPVDKGVTLEGTSGLSTLYFRCYYGNPGDYYDSIEICTRGTLVGITNNTTFDNLEIKYAGSHGFGSGTANNVHFSNCTISYIGGSAQYYTYTTGAGYMVRFGNGIEIYGSTDGFTIDNCYVYQCYDAGITHQHSAGGTTAMTHKNVKFTNNVIDKCIYNIEYFMGAGDTESTTRKMENILYSGNILARSGRGWGYQPSRSASIVGWNHHRNEAYDFVIRDNIFFGDYYNSIIIGAEKEDWLPDFHGNTYIVRYNGGFAKYGTVANTVTYKCLGTLYAVLENVLYDEDSEVYWINQYVN